MKIQVHSLEFMEKNSSDRISDHFQYSIDVEVLVVDLFNCSFSDVQNIEKKIEERRGVRFNRREGGKVIKNKIHLDFSFGDELNIKTSSTTLRSDLNKSVISLHNSLILKR
ncbi:hypothetical protein HHI36_014187 [Cryptolaemus montrouzieri]|uniref:Uncharacterized protein n=1 Tax=Cryptolaemus montrouzieri TaxID=559131 RepID=A0ABD2N248_9CUCU